jgi:hypothetical protein
MKRRDVPVVVRQRQRENLPKLWNRMNISQHSIQRIGIGHLRTPTVSEANEEHLLLRILTQARQSFVNARIAFHPVLIRLNNDVDRSRLVNRRTFVFDSRRTNS